MKIFSWWPFVRLWVKCWIFFDCMWSFPVEPASKQSICEDNQDCIRKCYWTIIFNMLIQFVCNNLSNKHYATVIGKAKINPNSIQNTLELKIIRLIKDRKIVVNEIMKYIIIIYRCNALFEIFTSFTCSNNPLGHSFIAAILVNVQRQGKSENMNDNWNDIVVVFAIYHVNNNHNWRSIIAMELNQFGSKNGIIIGSRNIPFCIVMQVMNN